MDMMDVKQYAVTTDLWGNPIRLCENAYLWNRAIYTILCYLNQWQGSNYFWTAIDKEWLLIHDQGKEGKPNPGVFWASLYHVKDT